VRWAHQIDIMTTFCLQGKHHIRQLCAVHGAAFTKLADAVVLTENAVQIAVGEEDGSRAMSTNQGRLFPEVWPEAGNDDLICCLAFTAFTVPAIDSTVAGTEMTPGK